MQTTSEIWIAEDDRSLRWVMEKAIKRDGIEVQSFENGDDLLAALQLSQPEISISDIRMPGIDGLELKYQIDSSFTYAEFKTAINQIPIDSLHKQLPNYLNVE